MLVTAPAPARLPHVRGRGRRAGRGLTVVHGPNGAGKTNLLEALYFGCTGRSCRTTNEREVVRFDAAAARVEVDGARPRRRPRAERRLRARRAEAAEGRRRAGRAAARRARRPLVSVFLPDRLELVKGPPALRRSHLDALVAALWPSRTAPAARTRRRSPNATRCWRGSGRPGLARLARAWDLELARHGIALRDDRAGRVPYLDRPLLGRRRRARAHRRRHAALPPAVRRRDGRAARRRAGGAAGLRPRSRVHRPRPAPRRAAAAARRPRAARLRLAGRAAPRAPGAAARRARALRRSAARRRCCSSTT